MPVQSPCLGFLRSAGDLAPHDILRVKATTLTRISVYIAGIREGLWKRLRYLPEWWSPKAICHMLHDCHAQRLLRF